MTTKRTEVELVINDSDASRKIDKLLSSLDTAKKKGGGLSLGDGKAGGAATPGSAAATPGGHPTTHSTARVPNSPEQHAAAAAVRVGGLLQQASTGGVGGAANAAGGLANMGMSAAMRSGSKFGPVGVVASVAAAAGFTQIAKGRQKHWQNMQELAGMERGVVLGGVAGGADLSVNSDSAKSAALYGIKAGQNAQAMSQYFSAIGVKGSGESAMQGATLHALGLGGIDAGTLAHFQGLGAAGGGAAGGMAGAKAGLRGALGIADSMGFRGQRTVALLNRIASATSNMAEQGLSLDLGAFNAAVGGLSGKRGFRGMNAVRGAAKLSQMGTGAASSFAGQFSGLANMAIQAKAFDGASGPLDAIKRMQEMSQNPLAVQRAISGTFGREGAALAFAGAGFTGAQAESLASGVRGRAPGGFPGQVGTGEGVARSRALALRENRELGSSTSMDQFRTMNESLATSNKLLLTLGRKLDGLSEGLSEAKRFWETVVR